MENNKNALEKKEIQKTIWSIAEDLRGGVSAWEFKEYIIGFLFYRYISENITYYINENEHKTNNLNFDYANLEDNVITDAIKESIIEEKGFFLYPSELFINVNKRAHNDENLNTTLGEIFKRIENSAKGHKSENDFIGLFDNINVNAKGLGVTVNERNKKLTQILNKIASMNLGSYADNSIDVFGDAYEYLISMYASGAGKTGQDYFTPQEVSEILARIAIQGKDFVRKVYDPACGSGSLLMQPIKLLGKDNIKQGIFGQEKEPTIYNLCRVNMFLHNIEYDKFSISQGDTLISPAHKDDEPFDVIVSNPPYSLKWEGDNNPLLINDERFAPAGVLAPKGKSDFAFIMHSLSWLSSDGTAAILCFPGIMYRGGDEQKIRKYLIDNNFIDAIIQLPSSLFFKTGIATTIMVLKKNKVDTNILFVDASNEFIKVVNSNKLTDENIKNIMTYYTNRENVRYVSTLAKYEDVKEKKYNLSVSNYVEKLEVKEKFGLSPS